MKILIATDGSPCSENAFSHVLNDSSLPPGCEFKVISVVEALIGTYAVAECYVASMVEAEDALKKERQKLVNDCIARLRKTFIDAKVSGVVPIGYTADQILECARKWPADLIVLGTHGRRGLNHFIMGSVAERVAREAECSVEIIRGGACQPKFIDESVASGKLVTSNP